MTWTGNTINVGTMDAVQYVQFTDNLFVFSRPSNQCLCKIINQTLTFGLCRPILLCHPTLEYKERCHHMTNGSTCRNLRPFGMWYARHTLVK